MLSGIGPAAHLKDVGISVEVDSAGVGENLQDHLDCYTVFECSGPYSYDGAERYLKQAWWGLQYLLFRNGPVTTNIVEAGAFVKVDPVVDNSGHAAPLPARLRGRPRDDANSWLWGLPLHQLAEAQKPGNRTARERRIRPKRH